MTLRRALLVLTGVLLSAATLAGICLGGMALTMAQSFPDTPPGATAGGWPAPKAVVSGRTVVAVTAGVTGSVGTDLLAPYNVFARSESFSVYVVAARREPVALSGGLTLLPDYTFDTAPSPDVVVVPAVVEPTGPAEAPLRDFIAAQSRRGAQILGVCAGVEVVAATGLLDGRRATSFWANLDRLGGAYPAVQWLRGKRYIEDGGILTTAGVTSGVAGALRLVERFAGAAEARRVSEQVAYPGSTLDIPMHRNAPSDAPYALAGLFPFFRPVLGIGLSEGVDELDIAAAFDVYSGTSSAFHAVPVAATGVVTTSHGAVLLAQPVGASTRRLDRLVVPGTGASDAVNPGLVRWASSRGLAVDLPHAGRAPGEFSYDPLLRDLAVRTDRATARTTAKFTEYPGSPDLTGAAWPWRPTLLAVLAILVSALAGMLPALIRLLIRRRTLER